MKGKWTLSDPCFPISALPHLPPRLGLGSGPLRRELAITRLDWSLAPIPRSGERIARQNPFEPPLGFRLASPCPGIDRLVSSMYSCDSGPFQTLRLTALRQLRAYWFPFAYEVEPLRLATTINSPARVSRRNVQPWSSSLVLPLHSGFLRVESTLPGCTRLLLSGFRHFSPPFRGAFQFSVTVLVRYRS